MNLTFLTCILRAYPKPRQLRPGPTAWPKDKVDKILTFKEFESLCQVYDGKRLEGNVIHFLPPRELSGVRGGPCPQATSLARSTPGGCCLQEEDQAVASPCCLGAAGEVILRGFGHQVQGHGAAKQTQDLNS